MNLSRNQKLAVGAATLWMLAYPFLFFALWFGMFVTIFASVAARNEPTPAPFFGIFLCMLPFHLFTMGIMFALMVFYWAHIIKNTTTSDTLRIIFGVGIFYFGYFVMPLYFFFFVWRDETPARARTQPTSPAQTTAEVSVQNT